MADSTAVIDTTSFIYVDQTGVASVTTATANTLVNDFSDQSQTMLTKATAIFGQLEDIKDLISSYAPSDFTPPALMDQFTQQALNTSFGSSAWLTAEDAIQNVQAVKQKCSVLNEVTKYADTSSMIDSLKGGVLKDAADAIKNVADQFKFDFPGLQLPESDIGKRLSDIANTGRGLYDKVSTEFNEAVSDVIEHGKGGLAKAQGAIDKASAAVDGAVSVVEGAIASMAGPLKMLDKMTNCVDAIGGSAFAGQTDQMIGRSDEIFGKLNVETDPNSPNFGEFDETTYLDSIGGLTPDIKSNIKKSMNMSNKATNNAVGVVEKAKAASKLSQDTSVSSLSSAATNTSTEQKKNFVVDNVKVEVDVPAVPGGAPASVITPVPATVSPARTDQTTPPAPAGTEYSNLVVEYEVLLLQGSNYLDYDPTMIGYNRYKSVATRVIPKGKTQNPKDLIVKIVLGNVIHEVGTYSNIFGEDDKFHQFSVTPINVRIYRADGSTPKNLLTRTVGLWRSLSFPESKFREFDPNILTDGTIKAAETFVGNAEGLDTLPTVANMETLLAL